MQGIPVPKILEVFNSAFSDYIIPMKLDAESFERKVLAEGISYPYSAGAFAGGELVGFILHGLDRFDGKKRVFNAATGVVPSYRGQRLVEKMYNYILPVLKEKGYIYHQLEVLEGNFKAERAYEKMGFIKTRDVLGYKGTVKANNVSNDISIREVPDINWEEAQSFWDVIPTWQNQTNIVKRGMERHRIAVAYLKDELAGYVVYDLYNGRIRQFAVKPVARRKGIGTALFAHVCNAVGDTHFINYDNNDASAKAFFKASGLEPNYRLHEMTLVYA